MILAGDVGGTKTRLALFSAKDLDFQEGSEKEYRSRDYDGPDKMIRQYLKELDTSVEAACFGIPGPVIDGEVRVTNLPWHLREQNLQDLLGIRRLRLVNDLTATTASVPLLKSSDIETLNEGRTSKTPSLVAVLAPGTGLGQGYMHMNAGQLFPFSSEGGHVEFAPRNALEIELLKFLLKDMKRVSMERILCGPGLYNIYRYFLSRQPHLETPGFADALKNGDPAALIAKEGVTEDNLLAKQSIELFCVLMGAQAGNLALTYLPDGGVYLGGGIPPKLIKKIREGKTMEGYVYKGRLSPVVQATPLHVILNDKAALLGAAHLASHLPA